MIDVERSVEVVAQPNRRSVVPRRGSLVPELSLPPFEQLVELRFRRQQALARVKEFLEPFRAERAIGQTLALPVE